MESIKRKYNSNMTCENLHVIKKMLNIYNNIG